MNDWIDVDIDVPVDDRLVLISLANYPLPIIGRYVEDEDGGANWYAGDDDEPLIKKDLFVNAWMPLPEPYRD